MTKKQTKKWIAEITAFANGAEILYYDNIQEQWIRTSDPLWYIDNLYIINDKHVEARKADALGEEIEYRSPLDSDMKWYNLDGHKPNWLESMEYRAKPKWTPKQGDMIEVLLEDGYWVEREFICMTKDNTYYITHTNSGHGSNTWDMVRELS